MKTDGEREGRGDGERQERRAEKFGLNIHHIAPSPLLPFSPSSFIPHPSALIPPVLPFRRDVSIF